MSKPLVLVTGSTGKTGTLVVEQLRARGNPVRAFVHQLDERSERLSELGAEVVAGDFNDLQSIRKAMRGVNRVYFCYPPPEQEHRLRACGTTITKLDTPGLALARRAESRIQRQVRGPSQGLSRRHFELPA